MYKPSYKLKRNGIPVLSHDQIEEHAAEFIRSFAPECLQKPQPLDIERFTDSYLELSQAFEYLSSEQYEDITRGPGWGSEKKKKVISLAAETFQVSKVMAGIRLGQVGALKFLEVERALLELRMIEEEAERRSREAREAELHKVRRGGRRKKVLSPYEKEIIEGYNRMMKRVEEMSNKK